MAEQHGDSTCEHQAAQESACWRKPDYEIVETSLEVTAYYSGLKS